MENNTPSEKKEQTPFTRKRVAPREYKSFIVSQDNYKYYQRSRVPAHIYKKHHAKIRAAKTARKNLNKDEFYKDDKHAYMVRFEDGLMSFYSRKIGDEKVE